MPSESNRCPRCNCAYCPVRTTTHKKVNVPSKDAKTLVPKTITVRERVCNHCSLPFKSYEIPEDGMDSSIPDATILEVLGYTLGPQMLKPPPVKQKQVIPPVLGKTTLKPKNNRPTTDPLPSHLPPNPFLK